jgi:membrane protein implicated in regulation of membrane protease activity
MEMLITIGMIYVLFKVAAFAVSAFSDLIVWSAKFIAFATVAGIAYILVNAQGLI